MDAWLTVLGPIRNAAFCWNKPVTFPCKLGWYWPQASDAEAGSVALVGSAVELRQQLAAIWAEAEARQIAIAVNVMTPENNAFSVVLGLGCGCIVTYDGNDGDPPYFVSLGDTKSDKRLVSYYFGGQRSELPASHVIPEDLAIDALVDSIENEQPSSLIQWYGG